jgi:hypothetical protein
MKLIGYALITVGFLGGSFEVVRRVEGVDAAAFLWWLAAGIVGVIVVRRAQRAAATDEEVLSSNIRAIEGSLRSIAADAERLNGEKETISVYDLRHRIDEMFPKDLSTFVDARESIAHNYGLEAYSDVMNRFAAGERYLNRVWSASTDGYVDEAHAYIKRAADQFEDALKAFQNVKAGRPVEY